MSVVRLSNVFGRCTTAPTRRSLHCVRQAAAALGCVAIAALAGTPVARASCPNEQLRAEDHSTKLPDCRSYELVSPTYKEGHPVVVLEGHISSDGSRVIGQSFGAFAGTEDVPKGSGLLGASYAFARTGSGWMTTPLTPPASQFAEDFSGVAPQLVSSDFDRTTWVLNRVSQPTAQRDLYLRTPDGAFSLVSPITPPAAAALDDNQLVAASTDLSHILFYLETNRWPGDTTHVGEGGLSLYEAAAGPLGGEPKLVAVKNNGALLSNTEAELISSCGASVPQSPGASYQAVSASGDTVIFLANECEGAPPVNELYARIKGSKTIALSEPAPAQCSSPACVKAEESERQEATFQGGSEDGTKVFFTTAQPLVDGDGDTTNDLYEAEITSAGIAKLIQVSRGDSSDATQGVGASVESVAAASKDGSRVFLVAGGVLTTSPNKQGLSAVAGAHNLYMVEPASGHTAFITGLAAAELETVRLTPDGRFLVFGSAGRLSEYDSQTGAFVEVANEAGEGGGAFVSSDGAYLFFASSAALAPGAIGDPSHTVRNVFEYHAGQISLISDGQDVHAEGTRLLGADASGGNVFFETLDSLVGQDSDTQTDIYDARIGGGFPTPRPPASCSGDGCQETPSPQPSFGAPGSSTFSASGNVTPPIAKPARKPLTRAQRLTKALKACRSKRDKHKRVACEAQARKRLGLSRAKKSDRGAR